MGSATLNCIKHFGQRCCWNIKELLFFFVLQGYPKAHNADTLRAHQKWLKAKKEAFMSSGWPRTTGVGKWSDMGGAFPGSIERKS